MIMADYTTQRLNMVESQVRPSDVTDRRIIQAMLALPRELFVPSAARATAYMDADLTVVPADGYGPGRRLLAPRTFAKLLQLAQIEADAIVLDIGCLGGYSSAVIAALAQTVIGLETDAKLAGQATRTLSELGINNIVVETGALVEGFAKEAPYDAIVVEGGVEQIPDALLDQLKDGGSLVAIDVSGRQGRGTVWRRIGMTFDCRPVFDASAVLLPGFETVREFAL